MILFRMDSGCHAWTKHWILRWEVLDIQAVLTEEAISLFKVRRFPSVMRVFILTVTTRSTQFRLRDVLFSSWKSHYGSCLDPSILDQYSNRTNWKTKNELERLDNSPGRNWWVFFYFWPSEYFFFHFASLHTAFKVNLTLHTWWGNI